MCIARYTDPMRWIPWLVIVVVLISTVALLVAPFERAPVDRRAVTTGQLSTIDRKERLDRLDLILTRLNHLEDILSSSLFTLMITTTLAMGGGAYAIRERKVPISGRIFFVGANFFYIVLSAHYYFMLTQFYSSFIFLVDQYQGLVGRLDLLWTIFRIPVPWASESTQSVLYLMQATVAPLLFSCFIALGLYAVFLRPKNIDDTGGPVPNPDHSGGEWIGLSMLLHLFVWVAMIWQPFFDFISALHSQVPA
jgi:hypothetical protein